MVLIFSSQANISNQIHREVERAVSKGIAIIPLRIEDVAPTSAMEYYLGAIHWLDALTPPLESHLQRLTEFVKAYLVIDPGGRHLLGRSRMMGQPSGAGDLSAIQAAAFDGRRNGSGYKNGAARRTRWQLWSSIAAVSVFILAGSAAFFYLKQPPSEPKKLVAEVSGPPTGQAAEPVPAAQPTAPPQVAQPAAPVPLNQPVAQPSLPQPAAAPADQPSTPPVFDEAAVRQLASKQKIPLPTKLAVDTPSAATPAQLAQYLGAWGSDDGWNGVGRNIIVVVESIDITGAANGVLAQGPPKAASPLRFAAGFIEFSSRVTNDGLNVNWGPWLFIFKSKPGDRLSGESRGTFHQQPVDFRIMLQRISTPATASAR